MLALAGRADRQGQVQGAGPGLAGRSSLCWLACQKSWPGAEKREKRGKGENVKTGAGQTAAAA